MTAMFLGTTQDEAILDIIEQVTEEFNTNNEFGVEFTYDTFAIEDYKTRLATVMAADDAPDVFFTWSAGFLQPYVEGGRVYEVGQLLEADDDWLSRFNEGVFGPVSYDGGIYAVPHGQTVAVMFYNTRLFEEYGVAVPTTHEELLAAVDTFSESGIIPISLPAQDRMVEALLPDTTVIAYTYDAAGHRVQQDVDSTITNYLWDEFSMYGDVVMEYDKSGTLT